MSVTKQQEKQIFSYLIGPHGLSGRGKFHHLM